MDEDHIVEMTEQFAALVGMTPVDDQSQRNFDMILSVLSSIRRIVLEGDFNDTELGQVSNYIYFPILSMLYYTL